MMVEAQNAPASVITSDSGSAGPACHITWEYFPAHRRTFFGYTAVANPYGLWNR
jgi:hypothetical protein